MRSNAGAQFREHELVAAGCLIPLSAAGTGRVATLLGNPIHWDMVLSTAEKWQVEPTLFRNLRLLFSGLIPVDVLERMRSRETELRASSIAQTSTMLDLLSVFESEGIEALVLKGPAVGVVAYGDPSLRPFGDIDILVRADRLLSAVSLMESVGYKVANGESDTSNHVTLTNDPTHVELHYTLFESRHRIGLDDGDLWRDVRNLPCLDGTISVLSPWHLFLFLCAHGAKHHWEKFRLILDLAQLSNRMTESEVGRLADLAKEAHATRILGLGAQLVSDCFPDNPPVHPRLQHYMDGRTTALAALVSTALGVTHADNGAQPDRLAAIHPYFFWVASRERGVDKLESLARFIFQPTRADSGPTLLALFGRPLRLLVNTARSLHSGRRVQKR